MTVVLGLRWVASLCLAVAVGLDPMAFPEHVHEPLDAHGAVHALAHRHIEAHAVVDHGPGHDRVLDHDETVISLENTVAVPRAPRAQPAAITSVILLESPPAATAPGVRAYIERFTHGPPRAPAIVRGPPTLSHR